jgi:outer membrane lipoprotein-sorting protein
MDQACLLTSKKVGTQDMCASHARLFVSAMLLFLLVTARAHHSFGDQRTRNEESSKTPDEVVAFQLIGKTSVPTTSFKIVYHSPYKWRYEDELVDLLKKVFICDGKTAWSYSIENSRVTSINKWDVEMVVKKFGPKLTYQALLGDSRVNAYSLANPDHQLWKKEFAFPKYEKDFVRRREEIINGTLTVAYESGKDVTIQDWFGKNDGLIRKESISDRGLTIYEMVVEEVTINPKVNDNFFHFTPPPRAVVIDKTETLHKEIEEWKALYKRNSLKGGPNLEKAKEKRERGEKKGDIVNAIALRSKS